MDATTEKNYDSLKLKNQLCFPLYAASREILRKYTPLLKKLGLTYTQYIVMMVLWETREATVSDLCKQLYLDSGTLSPLLKAMEEKGIGRPSTYAPTIMTLTSRYYVSKENKSLYVTELGSVVNDLMIKAFPDIADPDFTARMEEKLDDIAGGKAEWKEVIGEFYDDFRPELEKAEKELEKVEVKDEVSDEICEQCGRPMLIKIGRNGRFLACSGFPECRSTKPLLEKTGVKCPECGGDVLVKRTRKGRRYYGCEHNPECGYMVWRLPQERPSEGTN